MNNTTLPIGFTVKSKNGQDRLTYRPDWSQSAPWMSYKKGTAGRYFSSIQEAKQNGWKLETDEDRTKRAEHLISLGMEIPLPLPSVKDC